MHGVIAANSFLHNGTVFPNKSQADMHEVESTNQLGSLEIFSKLYHLGSACGLILPFS